MLTVSHFTAGLKTGFQRCRRTAARERACYVNQCIARVARRLHSLASKPYNSCPNCYTTFSNAQLGPASPKNGEMSPSLIGTSGHTFIQTAGTPATGCTISAYQLKEQDLGYTPGYHPRESLLHPLCRRPLFATAVGRCACLMILCR